MKITKHDYGAKSYPNCCLIGAKGNVRKLPSSIQVMGPNSRKYFKIFTNI